MAPAEYDFIIVGGGSAGSALANRLSADPASRVLVLEAGRPDYPWDVYIHMPAALTFPIGNRFYDWGYESEPEPHLNGRRIYHARGKVLGGSSSINGMIFQRGNPLDYERWGGRPGDGGLGLRALPAVLQEDGDLPGGRGRVPRRGRPAGAGARPGRRPAVPGVLRRGAAGRVPADQGRERVPPGGLRPVRPEHPPRPAAQRGPRLPAPGAEPAQPRGDHPRLRHQDLVRGHPRGRGRVPPGRCGCGRSGGPSRLVRGDEIILCGGAINTPQLLQLSGVGPADTLRQLGVHVRRRPARRGREPAGPPRGLRAVRLEAAGVGGARAQDAQPAHGRREVALPARRPRRHQPLRGRRVHPQQRARSRTRT